MTETVPPQDHNTVDTRTTVPGLQVANVRKSFGATQVLKDVSLSVPKGELHSLLGASGSGKTTLLRIIGGFTDADSGNVTIEGRDVTWINPEQRHAGFVFQSYALFPHLNIFDNIAFGLRLQRRPKREIMRVVTDTCDLTRMPRALLRRKPSELSGGQQQRVAIARALATRPSVLLLDEPLSALDRKVRQEVREELKRIQHDAGITTVFVTHDQEEALYLADRVLVMDHGVIVQSDVGTRVYGLPQSEFVAGFIGSINLLPATVTWRDGEPLEATVAIGGKDVRVVDCIASRQVSARGEERGILAVRPEQILLAPHADAAASDHLTGRIAEIDFTGSTATVRIGVGSVTLSALVFSRDVLGQSGIAVGQDVALNFAPGTVVMAGDAST